MIDEKDVSPTNMPKQTLRKDSKEASGTVSALY